MCVCVRVCARVRARARACVRACVCVCVIARHALTRLHAFTLKSETFGVPGLVLLGRGTAWHSPGNLGRVATLVYMRASVCVCTLTGSTLNQLAVDL